eukprot:scaffold191783_cov25-Tisochrysis_lutea.AAC.2
MLAVRHGRGREAVLRGASWERVDRLVDDIKVGRERRVRPRNLPFGACALRAVAKGVGSLRDRSGFVVRRVDEAGRLFLKLVEDARGAGGGIVELG